MKLYINEKVFSIHNRFFVYNEQMEQVYEISSKVISIGDKTTIVDMAGKTIAYIEQEIFHLTSNYNIYINETLETKITKKFQFFKNDYTLDNGYHVKGSAFAFDFSIYDTNEIEIASIKRKFFTIGDKYEINIIDENKLPLILSIIVAIINDVNHSQQASANGSAAS